MNRREFMECAAILISGVSASRLGFALSEGQRRHLADAPPYIATAVDYFSEAQRKTLAAIAETIIPRTDTPGAIDAGVPRYVELMVADWFNDRERAIFDAGLARLMKDVRRRHGKPFEALPEPDRVAVLERLEEAALDAPYYRVATDLFGVGDDIPNPFVAQVKELVTWGFFTSELGATQVLRYLPMPMKFEGVHPLGPDDSSWSGGFL